MSGGGSCPGGGCRREGGTQTSQLSKGFLLWGLRNECAPTGGRASPWHLHKACLTPQAAEETHVPEREKEGGEALEQADGKRDEAEEELRCLPSDGDRFGLVLIYPNMWHCHDVHLPESKPPDTCQNTGITAHGSPDTALHAGAPTFEPATPSRLAP